MTEKNSTQDIQKLYSDAVQYYGASSPHEDVNTWHALPVFVDALKREDVSHATSVLDIGAGGGLFLLELTQYLAQTRTQDQQNIRSVGVDINPDMTAAAQAALQSIDLSTAPFTITHQTADILAMTPQEEASLGKFDLITACFVLSHVDVVAFLLKIKSMLSEKGTAVIYDQVQAEGIADQLQAIRFQFGTYKRYHADQHIISNLIQYVGHVKRSVQAMLSIQDNWENAKTFQDLQEAAVEIGNIEVIQHGVFCLMVCRTQQRNAESDNTANS